VTECRSCGAKAHNAFLCTGCSNKLRKTLAQLPWWLHRLTETAIGQTRMSDNQGRKSAARRDLDGDAELASCIELLPAKEEDLAKARRLREKAALAHALATGGINARASELLAEISDSLGYWCRVLCESRGVTVPALPAGSALGASLAAWLAINTNAIALSEDAADIAGDIETHLEDIVKVVNRPLRIWFLGNCETWDDKRNTACGADLRAPEGSVEIYCNRCHVTHSVNRLFLARVDEAERQVVPFKELLRVNKSMPTDYQIAPRTLQYWRTCGLLRPHQWERLDGRRGLTQHDAADTPLYSWADVKRLAQRKPQTAPTGAAAHRKAQAQ